MSYSARKINYCYVTVGNRAGAAAGILNQIKSAGINLQAFSGFPGKQGKAQIDLVADKLAGIQKLARKNGWKLSKTKKAFLIQGPDKPGAVTEPIGKLAKQGINVTAAGAVAAGKGRYGMILWVKPKLYNRAARALKAKAR
jgi:hypothetical protein